MLRKVLSSFLTLTLFIQMNELAFAKTSEGRRKQSTQTAQPTHETQTSKLSSRNYDRIKKSNDFFATNLFSNPEACSSNDMNFFSVNQASGCIPISNNIADEKNRMQTELGKIAYNLNCSNASPAISVNFSNPDSVKYCKEVSKCLSSTFGYIDTMDPDTSKKMQCTLLFLTDTHKTMRMEKSVQNVFHEINVKDSLDNKLTKLMKLIATNLPKSEWKNVHFCPMKIKKENTCVTGMSNELVKSQVNKYLSNIRKKEAEEIKVSNARNQAVYLMLNNINIHPALLKKNQLQASANPERGSQATSVADETDSDGSNFADYDEDESQLDLKAQNIRSQISSDSFNKMLPQASAHAEKTIVDRFKSSGIGSVKLDKEDTFFEVVKKFDISFDDLAVHYMNEATNIPIPKDAPDFSKKSSEYQVKVYSDYLISVSNKILDKYCDQSTVYNAKTYCSKIESELRDNDEMDRYDVMDKIGAYIEDAQGENVLNRANGLAGISPKLIKDANRKTYDKRFNYADFLSQVGFMQTCVQHFGNDSFNSDNEQSQFSQLNSKSEESIIEKTNNVVSDQKRNFRELLNQNNQNDNLILGNTINKNQKMNLLSGLSASGINEVQKADLLNVDKKSDVSKPVDTARPNNLTDASLYNTLSNSVKNNSQNLPANNNSNSYLYQPTNTSGNDRSAEYESNSIQRKLEELSKKEAELKEKSTADNSGSTTNTKEVESLQKQIEELRNQLSETKKTPVAKSVANVETKENTVKELSANNNPSSSYDYKKQTYAGNNTKQNDRSNESSSSDSSRFESASIGSSGGAASAQAIASRSTGSIPNGKNSEGVKSFGLVLTKSGETTEDLSKIADNPKDSDILVLAEKSNGQPFIIRENGDLVQVQIKVDSKGKPVYVNGKPEFIKKKLSKEAQVQVAKNAETIREAKEVRDTVRLQQLNQLMQSSK